MRAAIYARYSSDLQSDTSIEDQIEVCRRYARHPGWTVTNVYEDRAISGASTMRPGFMAMMEDVGNNRFDVVLAESLDRIGRRVADVAGIHDELTFAGIALHTVATGEVTALLAGILKNAGHARGPPRAAILLFLDRIGHVPRHRHLFAEILKLDVRGTRVHGLRQGHPIDRRAGSETVGVKHQRLGVQLQTALQLRRRRFENVQRHVPRVLDLWIQSSRQIGNGVCPTCCGSGCQGC